jgi:hypothetical protein
MIETLAQAVFDSDNEEYRTDKQWSNMKPWVKEDFCRCVRAVLKALENPSEAMVEAGYDAAVPALMNNKWDEAIAPTFTAMIRAASVEDETR